MRFLDSSRLAADHVCPRSRYWGYQACEGGIVPMTQNPDLVFGLIMAQAIEQLRKGLPPWPLLDALDPQSWTLAQGLLAA